jgi:putative hydrolase of the HAD superfamily
MPALRRRAVLLDAMGTLLRLEPPGPALARRLREHHGLAVSTSAAERALGAEMRYYRAHHDEGHDESSLRDLRLRCAQVLGEALGAQAQSIPPQALVGSLLGALHFSAYDDAAPALRALRAEGRRLVVVSNWDISLPRALQQAGLAPLLDGVVTSAAVGASKPLPQIFAAALRVADARPAEALHVGDSVEHDVAGARSAGIEALLLDRGAGPRRSAGATVIGSLSELAQRAA